MTSIHSPDPQFVGNLEQELRSTIRRQGRFDNGPPGRARLVRNFRRTTALIALAALCIGSAGTFAVTHRLRSQAADLIVAKSEAHLEFANARAELVLEQLQETELRAAAGVYTVRELDSIRLRYARVEADAVARTCDVEEARITGVEPDNSLSAPILRGRDFVTERLELEQALLGEMISTFKKQATAYGLDMSEPSWMTRERENAQAAMSAVDQRLTLRRDYLSGARTTRQVELAQIKSSVEQQREMATRRVNELQPQLDRYRTLFEEGFVVRAEVRQVEMEFRAAMLQLDLAELEMQILERKLADPSDK